jgi:N-acetylneuraminate lyase
MGRVLIRAAVNESELRVIHPNFRLIAPPFTPMHGDGTLNLSPIPAYAKHLVATGVRGVFVGGTSGEGQSLSVDERIALVEAWGKTSERRQLELIVHIGHNTQSDAMRLAAHAQSVGADKIAMHGPTWFKSLSVGDLVDFCAPVAAAAPKLPFYLYDIPIITGIHISSAQFLRHAEPRVPTLAGLKFTNPDVITAQECIQLDDGKFDVLWGTDESLLAGAALGAAGGVGTLYNFAARRFLHMLSAAEQGDWQAARREQARVVSLVRLCQQYTPLAALKYIMSLIEIDCGPTRPPVANLSDGDKQRLRSAVLESQFLTHAD